MRTISCSESNPKTAEICNRWIYIAVANSSGNVDVGLPDEHVAIANSPRLRQVKTAVMTCNIVLPCHISIATVLPLLTVLEIFSMR
jgi:hypothetical protein